MTQETLFLNNIISFLTVLSNIFFLVIIIALLFRRQKWSTDILLFLKEKSYKLAFLLSLGGVVGSLVYSSYIGFEPCVLCWYQRIFLFSLTIILFVALIRKEKISTSYLLSLSIPGFFISLYQYGVTMLGLTSLTACTDLGGGCSITYFVNFGYVTIPFMALSIFALVSIIIFTSKLNLKI